MSRFFKKIIAVLLVTCTCFGTIFSTQTFAASNNQFSSPEKYIEYLDSFNDEYDAFASKFKSLSTDKQEKILDVLKNGGKLDIIIKKPSNEFALYKNTSQNNVACEASLGLFGVDFVVVRLEGRFTHSGATVKKVKYKNAYIVKNLLPLSGFERTSLDAYVSGGRFYANAAFTAYVGAKIGDNIVGVNPRTFYIECNFDGYGNGTVNAW